MITMNNKEGKPREEKVRSWDSSVGIVTGYKLDVLGSVPSRGKRFLSTPQHPN
jgi:hypothetical protein